MDKVSRFGREDEGPIPSRGEIHSLFIIYPLSYTQIINILDIVSDNLMLMSDRFV